MTVVSKARYPRVGQCIALGGVLWQITDIFRFPNDRIGMYEVVDVETGRLMNAFAPEEVRNR